MDLREINITSGVNEDHQPFCTVAAVSEAGDLMVGQLGPATVRQMALAWLESAEAAEQDAAVMRVLTELIPGDRTLARSLAASIVTELRNTRGA